ncbi:MAG: citrulline utilization hydrolase CtlX [Candidatus Cyclobacteriaceae bacterium M2_1C_046]
MDQAAHTIIMIRPASFGFNPETASSNVFQEELKEIDPISLAKEEFDEAVKVLLAAGVQLKLFEDSLQPKTPDAVFSNNWFFTLPEGKIVLCPMESSIRRRERRMDILSWLKDKYAVSDILDLTGYEMKEKFLEGTGSIVFDHKHNKAYACPSSRTDEDLFQEVCDRINYTPVLFQSRDEHGKDIYHTNVILSIGSGYAVVCLDAIHPADHEVILGSLADDKIQVIAISFSQMRAMAGNVLEVQTSGLENVLIMSTTASESLLPGQLDALSKQIEIVTVSIPTIEKVGGGGVRCMLAGVHLPATS